MAITDLYNEKYFNSSCYDPGRTPRRASEIELKLFHNTAYFYPYCYLQCEANLADLKSQYKNFIQEHFYRKNNHFANLIKKADYPDQKKLKNLPENSWIIDLEIELQKNFISDGDENFYCLENNIAKDAGSNLPLIKSTTWKGNFINTFYYLRPGRNSDFFTDLSAWSDTNWINKQKILETWLQGNKAGRIKEILNNEHDGLKNTPLYAIEEIYRIYVAGNSGQLVKEWKMLQSDNSEQYNNHPLTILHQIRGNVLKYLQRLCGSDDVIQNPDSKMAKDEYSAIKGELNFWASYFKRVSYDIIAPVEREGRTVKKPIAVEVIPGGETGRFYLVYIPNKSSQKTIDFNQSLKDLYLTLKVVTTMLEKTGFSAKTNTEYGNTNISGGKILVHSKNTPFEWESESENPPVKWELDIQYNKFVVDKQIKYPDKLEIKDFEKIAQEILKEKVKSIIRKDKNLKKKCKKVETVAEKLKIIGKTEDGILDLPKLKERYQQCEQYIKKEKNKYKADQNDEILQFTLRKSNNFTITYFIEKLKNNIFNRGK